MSTDNVRGAEAEGWLRVEDLGVAGYAVTLELQRRLNREMVEAKRSGGTLPPERLLLVEHPDVITLGKHAVKENVLFSVEELRRRGVELFEIERGGDVTYHGPGQLVAYLIMDLERRKVGVWEFMHRMEEGVIRTISRWGIAGRRVEGATGVWLDVGTPRERKICAMGIKCSRFVTMHGLALNVNTDLDRFRLINPCGFIDKGVTSMERELGEKVPMDEVRRVLAEELTEVFG